MIYKVAIGYLKLENIPYNTCAKHLFQKTATLIVLSTELHLSKSNASHNLFLLCGDGTAASCLATMNWKMLGWCFLTTFANLEFHPSTWLFVHLSVSV